MRKPMPLPELPPKGPGMLPKGPADSSLRLFCILGSLAALTWVSEASAQPSPRGRPALPPAMEAHRTLAREAISGARARELVAFMDPSYRVPGNEPFNAALGRVVEILEEAGYREEGTVGSPAPVLTYRLERRPLEQPTWEPVSASLSLVGEAGPLVTLDTNINLVAANSYSTTPEGVEAELVDVGDGSPARWEGLDVGGKVVMGDGSPRRLFRRAVHEGGALGVLAWGLADYNRPEVNRNVARMSSIPHDPGARAWGLLLTTNARDALRDAAARGDARVRVRIDSRVYPSEELTLVADVRGSERPDERFVLSAHVQESGANDNASGVAALAEIARVLGEGLTTAAFRPQRTISMIWGDEIRSTRRYVQEDSARAAGIRWGMSLDMVGEDTEKTGGTFLIEKMPDPSAVWTRGDDRHTEWGGRPLSPDALFPHFFNDLVLNRCLDQAAGTDWVVGTNPYEGGSDHVPFLRAGIPGLLLWHFTDQFYHTDGDRLEMVSASTLENVSVCAVTTAMALTDPDGEVAVFLLGEVKEAGVRRLEREGELSRAAVRGGAPMEGEREILESWARWYDGALETVSEVEVGGASAGTLQALEAARARLAAAARAAVRRAGGR